MSSRAERGSAPVAHLAHGRGPVVKSPSSLCSGPLPSFLSFFLPLGCSSPPPSLSLSSTPTLSFRERYRFHASHSVDGLEGRGKIGRRRRYRGGRAEWLFSTVTFPPPLRVSTGDPPLLLRSVCATYTRCD